MKRLLFIAICALFCACNQNTEPVVLPSIPTEHCSFRCITNGRVAYFYNSSTGLKNYLWQFGDGATSTENDPTHRYNAAGKYTATLTGYDKNNKPYTSSTTLTIE